MNDQQALIYQIIATGEKTVLTSEPVLEGLTRPLIVQYSASLGVANEIWDYVRDSAMTPWWGAINSVSYVLISTGSVLSPE